MTNFINCVRARHENFNARLKCFKIFSETFRGSWGKKEEHKMVFEAICILVQYEMENGHPLMETWILLHTFHLSLLRRGFQTIMICTCTTLFEKLMYTIEDTINKETKMILSSQLTFQYRWNLLQPWLKIILEIQQKFNGW